MVVPFIEDVKFIRDDLIYWGIYAISFPFTLIKQQKEGRSGVQRQ